jgi:ABC-type nitrate/sulfonate/bicarbonate transport system substrate-binding protein
MDDRLRLAYRDHDRTPLLYAIRDQAARFENLAVEILHVPGGKDYRDGFLGGAFELICEHLRFLFPARLEGHPVRCLAATELHAVDRFVAAQPLRTAEQFAGKTVAVRDQESSRLTLKYWLKSLGVADRVKIEVYTDEDTGRWEQWRKIVSGDADIALCSPLYLKAPLAAGLHLVEVPPLPVVGPLFFATRASVIRDHEDAVRKFMRALYRAVHAFRNDPEYAISIMEDGPAALMGLKDAEAVRAQYTALRDKMAEKPVPGPECILNTHHMVQEVFDVAALNPLELWDLHYVIELEEQGFMASLSSIGKPRDRAPGTVVIRGE